MKNKNFYITTPLYYVNDRPHLGTAYTTIIADILNRYNKFFGKETFFLTGTDEHGQKCEKSAFAKGLETQKYCDEMSRHFKETWEKLEIKYDLFFRTSSDWHKKALKQLLGALYDQGDIYSSVYKGWYCISEEIFYTDKDLVDGKSPYGKEVIRLEEPAWFFKMSKYQDSLKNHINNHPDFIQPAYRRNEIKAFLKKPFQDLCISRPKKRVSWGVELPFDKNCVVYVWVDALCNYITGAGYLRDEKSFRKWWVEAENIHLIGKDILMTHGIYWPCLLLALKLPLPKTLLVHGWLLNKDREKMSKSKGEKLDPIDMSKILGQNELRWFLAKEISIGKDSYISKSLIIKKVNEDLADNLGNIFSRVLRLIEKYFAGIVPKGDSVSDEEDDRLRDLAEKTCKDFKNQIEMFELSEGLQNLTRLLTEVNKYLERRAPWTLIKTNKEKSGLTLYNSLEVLRLCAILFSPVMPSKMNRLLSALGERALFENVHWRAFPFDKVLKHPQPLFPKIREKTSK